MKRKIFSILFALVLVVGFSLVTAVPAAAATINVPGDYPTIQAAVNAASASDTIIVAAGTYDEQVVINKSLTLEGAGDTTIVQPSSAATLTQAFDGLFWWTGTKNIAGIIVANVPDGSSVTIKNLKVDESLVTIRPTTTPATNYLAGIFYRETDGTIDTVTVVGTGQWIPDRAYGMYLSAATNTVTVEVKNSSISNWDKNGIEAHGNTLTASIHHNTLTGRSPALSGDEVPNGVNIGRGALGMVNNNTITTLGYVPETWLSTGIMFCGASNSSSADNNIITNCQIGIAFDSNGGSATGNHVTGGTLGRSGLILQNYLRSYLGSGSWTASFVNNTVSGFANTGIGIWGAAGTSLTATISGNQLLGGAGDGIGIGGPGVSITTTITNNAISGWAHGINLASSLSAVTLSATISGNTITNNTLVDSGIHIETAVNADNVSVNFNNIVGNQDHGINNEGTGTLDAENNWWGNASGPTHTGNPDGTGDAVSDNVDYEPWLTAAVAAAQTGESPPTVGPTDVIDAEVEVLEGSGTVTVAQYEDNPGTSFSGDVGKYIDVHIDDLGTITQIEIRLYYTDDEIEGLAESSLRLYWWDGSDWVECSDSGVNTEATNDYSGYIWARIRDDTTPSLDDLTGTPFGGSGSPRIVGGTVYPVDKVSILMPWIGLAVALALAGVFGAKLARSRVRG